MQPICSLITPPTHPFADGLLTSTSELRLVRLFCRRRLISLIPRKEIATRVLFLLNPREGEPKPLNTTHTKVRGTFSPVSVCRRHHSNLIESEEDLLGRRGLCLASQPRSFPHILPLSPYMYFSFIYTSPHSTSITAPGSYLLTPSVNSFCSRYRSLFPSYRFHSL